jgi:hypothetical protein
MHWLNTLQLATAKKYAPWMVLTLIVLKKDGASSAEAQATAKALLMAMDTRAATEQAWKKEPATEQESWIVTKTANLFLTETAAKTARDTKVEETNNQIHFIPPYILKELQSGLFFSR